MVGLERPSRAFWVAAVISFIGVGADRRRRERHLTGSLLGDLLAVGDRRDVGRVLGGDRTADAALLAVPDQRRRPRRRLRPARPREHFAALAPELRRLRLEDVAGVRRSRSSAPLFLTNILWFTALDRVGPSRASLFANLQPFFAVLFALVLLSERLNGGRSSAASRSRPASLSNAGGER